VIDVHLTTLILTPSTTPKLSSVKLKNVPDDCDIELELPELEYSRSTTGGGMRK
jgi:hypothetical protein